MINFLIIVLIIAVAAYLSNALMGLDRAISAVKARIRASNDTVARLEEGLVKINGDCAKITKEVEDIDKEEVQLRGKLQESQRKLLDMQSRTRQQLLILSDRREAGDKEWIVTVTNQQIGEIDASHPYAQEWMRGREYLVWATGDREAAERTMRRFSARPGFQVRGVVPAGDDVYAAPIAAKSES